jgi:hypothetical protein
MLKQEIKIAKKSIISEGFELLEKLACIAVSKDKKIDYMTYTEITKAVRNYKLIKHVDKGV